MKPLSFDDENVRTVIQRLLEARPFRSFSIHMASGQSYTIEAPSEATVQNTDLILLRRRDRPDETPYEINLSCSHIEQVTSPPLHGML